MNYHPPNWTPWQQPSHSNEIERRLTRAEDTLEHHSDLHEDHEETHSEFRNQLAIHEKAILGICGLLLIVLQDKLPAVADILKGLMK